MDYRTKYMMCKKVLFITFLGIITYLILSNTIFKQHAQILSKPINCPDTVKFEVFNEYNLKKYMNVLDIKHADIVLNQAKLETGHFTSKRFKKHNALFGFQISDTNVIKYKSWKESVIDYKCWQMKKLKNDENYYTFLIRIHYASDTNYIKKLKQFKNV